MQKQSFIYSGIDALDIIDSIADAIDALPYDAIYSQFEGNNEIFFTFLVNAYNEEYSSIITSSLSFKIEHDLIEVDVLSVAPIADMGLEDVALKQQLLFWNNFFKGFGFGDNADTHEHHAHECECEEHNHECDCGNHHYH